MTSTSRVGFLFSSFSREEQGLISRGTRSEDGNAARPRNGSLLFNCSPGLPAVLPRKSRLSPSHCLSLSHQMRRLPAYQLHRPAASSLGPSSSSAVSPVGHSPEASGPSTPPVPLHPGTHQVGRSGGACLHPHCAQNKATMPALEMQECLCPGHRAVTQGLPCRLKPRPLGDRSRRDAGKGGGMQRTCSPPWGRREAWSRRYGDAASPVAASAGGVPSASRQGCS